jgi:hypothetical protein
MAGLYDHKRWQKLPWYVCLPIKDGKNSYNRFVCLKKMAKIHMTGLFANKKWQKLPWQVCMPIKDGKNSHGRFVCS